MFSYRVRIKIVYTRKAEVSQKVNFALTITLILYVHTVGFAVT